MADDRSCAACSSRDANKCCARCRYVYFCSRECQRTCWPKHKLTCSPTLFLRPSCVGAGLGCFTRTAFSTGDEIVREAPLLLWQAAPIQRTGEAGRAEATIMLEQQVAEQFSALPASNKQAIMELCDTQPGTEKSLMGIIRSNVRTELHSMPHPAPVFVSKANL